MRLATLNRVLSVVLVALASLPLLMGGELPTLVWIAVAASLAIGIRWGDKTWPRLANIVVTAGVIGAFGVLVAFSTQSGDWLPNSFIFGLIAASARALQLPTSRQQFQMIGLSFLLLIASAVGNPDLSFALFFLVYTVILTWCLTSVHFMEKVERTYGAAAPQVPASRLLSRRYMVGSSVLALTLLASSLLLFFLFPRMGLGFFSAQTRKGTAISGFTDRVELGHFGTIRDSQRVVLRLEFPDGMPGDPALFHVRGMALDEYRDGAWNRSHSKQRPMRMDDEGFYLLPTWAYGTDLESPKTLMDVYAEPMEQGKMVAFTVARATRVRPEASRFDRYRGMEKRFTVDPFGSLYLQRGREDPMSAVSYSVEVMEPVLTSQARTAQAEEWPDWFAAIYLQLPRDLDPRIPALAQEWTGSTESVYEKAARIEAALRSTYGYSLEGDGPKGDPVSHFLFERKEGHCEYFASSMVLLLRTVNVPARLVNGFLGASKNEFGDYYVVTESRAHSWVEAYVPELGWMVFDPTPPAGAPPEVSGFWSELSDWFDSMRLTWFKWVVEYDLDRQLGLYIGIWNAIASKTNQIEVDPDASLAEMREQWKKVRSSVVNWETLGWIVGVLALGALIPVVVRRVRGKRRADSGRKLAEAFQRLLARKGVDIRQSEPLPDLARRSGALGFQGALAALETAQLIEEYRWHPQPVVTVGEIRRNLRRLKRFPPIRSSTQAVTAKP